MTSRRTAWASLGLAALLTLAACGGGDDKDTTDSTSAGGAVTTVAGGAAGGGSALAIPDPCALVTVEEVSAAFGGSPIAAPEGSDLAPPVGGRSCIFINSDAPPLKTIQIVARTDASFGDDLRANGQTVEKLYQDTKNQTENAEDVKGLGDQAYKTGRAYFVLDGGVYLETNLGFNATPNPEAVAALKTLTEKAVARL